MVNLSNRVRKNILAIIFATIFATFLITMFRVFAQLPVEYIYLGLIISLFIFSLVIVIFSYQWDALFILGVFMIGYILLTPIFILSTNSIIKDLYLQFSFYHSVLSTTIVVGSIIKMETVSYLSDFKWNLRTSIKQKSSNLIFKEKGFFKFIIISFSTYPSIITYMFLVLSVFREHSFFTLALIASTIGYVQLIVTTLYLLFKVIQSLLKEKTIFKIGPQGVIVKNRLGNVKRELDWDQITKVEFIPETKDSYSIVNFTSELSEDVEQLKLINIKYPSKRVFELILAKQNKQ